MKALTSLWHSRKDTLLGFLLIILAFILLLSLATYNTDDMVLLDDVVTWSDFFSLRLVNSFGVAGAIAAESLLWLVGRSSFLVPLILILIGWRFLWNFQSRRLTFRLLQVFMFVFALGTIMLLLNLNDPTVGERLTLSLAGKLGLIIAGFLATLIGTAGGFALLAAIMLYILISVVPYRPKNIRESLSRGFSFVREKSSRLRQALTGIQLPRLSFLSGGSDTDSEEDIEEATDEKGETAAVQTELLVEETAGREGEENDRASSQNAARKRATRKLNIVKAAPEVAADGFKFPTLDLLENPPDDAPPVSQQELDSTARALKETLETFKVEIADGRIEKYPGPVITRYEFKPAPGIKINQIVNLSDDLALALKAKRIRIIAPVPGKSAVGVEIPNRKPQMVYLREILESDEYQSGRHVLPLAFGKDTAGNPCVADLAKMPHLLIAGATGSGKSVCLNAIITSLIYRHPPADLRFIMIDPKILELSIYSKIPYLARPVINKARMVESVLATAVAEMEQRYRKLAEKGVRSLYDYNRKVDPKDKLPYLIIIVDELADMMMAANSAKTELLITRLAQMARAVGIHLILATQRPSVDVITGLIKANFSSRVAFQVASRVDSRTILDGSGAERLLGDGDMLFMPTGEPEATRIHGAWISSAETERVVNAIRESKSEPVPLASFSVEKEKLVNNRVNQDTLIPDATEIVIRHKQGSVSLLQRRLGIGYQRAARIMDQLEATGIVGPYDGSKAREVLVDESYLEEKEQ